MRDFFFHKLRQVSRESDPPKSYLAVIEYVYLSEPDLQDGWNTFCEPHCHQDRNDIEPWNCLLFWARRFWDYNTKNFEKIVSFLDTGAEKKTIIVEELAWKPKPALCQIVRKQIVSVKIVSAYGKDLEIVMQAKPILSKGSPSVKLSPMDQEFL